jgi:hypothetical protein
MMLLLAGYQFVYADQQTLGQSPNSKALQSNNQQESSSVKQLALKIPMCPMPQSSPVRLQSLQGVIVPDSNRVGA